MRIFNILEKSSDISQVLKLKVSAVKANQRDYSQGRNVNRCPINDRLRSN